jgi:hypothetical protein
MLTLAICLNGGMPAAENRLAHFRQLVESEAAAQAAGRTPTRQHLRAAYKIVASATGLQEEYVYQLYKGHKTKIGDDAAAKLDRAYASGRARGWIDLPPADASPFAVREPSADYSVEPIRPPSIEEAVNRLAEVLFSLDDDGRAMASTALSNLARNPRRADKTSETLEMLLTTYPREPDPTSPTPVVEGASVAAAQSPGKARLTVKAGGGKKIQMSLPFPARTAANPWDNSQAPTNERAWYERLKSSPKASSSAKEPLPRGSRGTRRIPK